MSICRCSDIDIVSLHSYNLDSFNLAYYIDHAKGLASPTGKRLIFEEFGAEGSSKQKEISSAIKTMISVSAVQFHFLLSINDSVAQAGIPWIYWELAIPGKSASNYEVRRTLFAVISMRLTLPYRSGQMSLLGRLSRLEPKIRSRKRASISGLKSTRIKSTRHPEHRRTPRVFIIIRAPNSLSYSSQLQRPTRSFSANTPFPLHSFQALFICGYSPLGPVLLCTCHSFILSRRTPSTLFWLDICLSEDSVGRELVVSSY